MNITQHLWFEKDMEAAIGLYTSLIPNSRIDNVTTLPAETPAGPSGSVKSQNSHLQASAIGRWKPGRSTVLTTVSPSLPSAKRKPRSTGYGRR